MEIVSVFFAVTLPVLYAVSEAYKAYQHGEKIQWPILLKTVVLAFVTAGIITQQTADMLIELSSTMAVTYVLDKVINAIIKKREIRE